MLTYPAGLYRDLNFDLSLHLYPFFLHASSEGSDKAALLHGLATDQCDKYQILICYLRYIDKRGGGGGIMSIIQKHREDFVHLYKSGNFVYTYWLL